jgi:hypothetical protein
MEWVNDYIAFHRRSAPDCFFVLKLAKGEMPDIADDACFLKSFLLCRFPKLRISERPPLRHYPAASAQTLNE